MPPAYIPSPIGTSLSTSLFPHVEVHVLLDVVRHEFDPSDLPVSKLDPKYRDHSARVILDFDGSVGGFTIRNPSLQDLYPSLHSIFAPLTTYFQILTTFAASSGSTAAVYQVASGSYAYLSQLVQFDEEYQWSAVLAYHMDFHHKRRKFMTNGDYSGWNTIDRDLQAKHLFGKESTSLTAVRSTSS
ncbi:hypothetical protein BV20DRAFT_955666 [Pilatotrama ljubarskyi]|nr:hypothetical protein BV20DRAFT_955666 [Pilatotrama ljubarskyi]